MSVALTEIIKCLGAISAENKLNSGDKHLLCDYALLQAIHLIMKLDELSTRLSLSMPWIKPLGQKVFYHKETGNEYRYQNQYGNEDNFRIGEAITRLFSEILFIPYNEKISIA